jgi:pyrroline-5-carboxylate reductase
MTVELAIIGAGNMAEAIARGILRGKLIAPDRIRAADPTAARRQLFESELGVAATDDNASAVRGARVILLSVKPYQAKDVLAQLGMAMDPDALLVSIAAGISSGFIEEALGQGRPWRIVRTMPNTPMLVGSGMAALSAGRHATAADMEMARALFAAAATVIQVDEARIDAVTAISGSGPAYFFFLVEQLISAGIELGLSPSDAATLAKQTALGAARMMVESKDSPAELRGKVTTPNGTTHAAITHMEECAWPRITREAVQAAAKRSKELGK